jgi:hypothetical protein
LFLLGCFGEVGSNEPDASTDAGNSALDSGTAADGGADAGMQTDAGSDAGNTTDSGFPPFDAGPRDGGVIPTLQYGEWYEVPNSKLNSVLPNPIPAGTTGPVAITDAWGGAAWDELRDRLLVTGGGHGDYAGNEVYAWSFDTGLWTRLTEPYPTTPLLANGPEEFATGQPASRHTYDGLVYLTTLDALFMTGGSLWSGSGGGSRGAWLLRFASGTPTWERQPDAYGTQVTAMAEFDPSTGRIFSLVQNGTLGEFAPATQTWSQRTGAGTFSEFDPARTMVLDDAQRQLLVIGGGHLQSRDLSQTSPQPTDVITSGGDALVNAQGPGLVYHPVRQRVIGWAGGGAVYELNFATRVWTAYAPSSPAVPPTSSPRGVYGRWQYVKSRNVFVAMNRVDENVWVYRLSP